MAMLPKPGEVQFRTVAKAPMLYRIWGACRRPQVVLPWEQDNIADWDKARPGSGALDVAYHRAFEAEVDRYNGHCYGVVLWDFTKFFDTVDPCTLIGEAVELGFPVSDLVLAMRMHLAPRCLMLLGVVSMLIQPLRSILPGCILAVALTRVYLRRQVGQLVDENKDIKQTMYIDDSGQYGSGLSPGIVGFKIARAAVAFVRMAQLLCLTLSVGLLGKSVLVTNSPRIADIVKKHFAVVGVTIKIQCAARDLGATFVGGLRRRTIMQKQRLQGAGSRFCRMRFLSRACHLTRKVGRTNPICSSSVGM